ncbi:MAG: flagellar biosynthesis protein FlhF [Blastocatellia bacterium]|nr:flagellar biosynthesis protein FlhF [Blastocatellia bacterium]
MKIKSYKAASLREALIRIKQELGEDALVIETKQVRAGGFLGVGARDLVEVRVALNPKQEAAKRRQPPARPQKGGERLRLADDSAAAPARTRAKSGNAAARAGAMATLLARAYAASSAQAEAKPGGAASPARGNGVELAETAPRIVHRRPAPKPVAGGGDSLAEPLRVAVKSAVRDAGASSDAPAQGQTLNAELARLRAEVREMKFAIDTFSPAPRREQASPAFESDPELIQSPYYEACLELTAAGVPPDRTYQAMKHAIRTRSGRTRDIGALGRDALAAALPSWVRFAETPLASCGAAVFIGPTGVGKTTTIAKLAARIVLRARQRVELITLDTYRIAAVQQLKTYAEIIGAGFHIANSVVELDALMNRFAGKTTVLIDSTGRSPHDLADQMDLADHLRENDALLKCLVLPATTQLADAQLALRKFALYGVNRLVLTKLDETMQPGAAIAAAASASLPLLYLCAGQRVPEDLERATPASLAARVLRRRMAVRAG